ncbi:hypothetical protein, partial [Massilia sp. X63]|uniref:hypothetical protein n=1 Tax=Massilia sp. X63 TaxID=3237285 RepID=UPI0034DD6B1D
KDETLFSGMTLYFHPTPRRAEQDIETGRRMQKQAETIPRRIWPSNRLRSVANFQAVNALSCVSKRPKTRYRRPVCRQRPVLAAKIRGLT